jgi:hypothetical protein
MTKKKSFMTLSTAQAAADSEQKRKVTGNIFVFPQKIMVWGSLVVREEFALLGQYLTVMENT